jgi:hypothetical protein
MLKKLVIRYIKRYIAKLTFLVGRDEELRYLEKNDN